MLLPTARLDARRPILAIGVAVIALIPAQSASAAWTAPFFVSPAPGFAAESDVAVDADGDAVLAWEHFDGANTRIQARARTAAGVLSPVQTLSAVGQNATEPDVAVDADGDAVVAWERSDGADIRVQARARSAAGVLSPVQILSHAGQDATRVRADMDADGDAVFVWQRPTATDLRVQARARSAAGVLSGVQDLSAPGTFSFSPDVAVDADGDAMFTWTRFSLPGPTQQIVARARSAAGALSAVQTLSAAGQPAQRPVVGIRQGTGDAVFAWQRSDGANVRIQGRARTAAGVLSAVQTLSAAGQNAEAAEVAVDGDGDAIFAWERFDGANTRIQTVARTAAGVLSAVQYVSHAGQAAADVEHDVDADGDAVFTWERVVLGVNRIQSRTRSIAGVLGPVQNLSAAGADADEAQVDVDDTGDAVSTWERLHAGVVRIQGAAGP